MNPLAQALEAGTQEVQAMIVPAAIFTFLVLILLFVLTLFVPSFRENYGTKVWSVFLAVFGTGWGLAFIPYLYQLGGGR